MVCFAKVAVATSVTDSDTQSDAMVVTTKSQRLNSKRKLDKNKTHCANSGFGVLNNSITAILAQNPPNDKEENILKEIKLMKLSLKNFKGVKDITLEFNGGSVRIYGGNKVGKTTLADAFNWLLFNKDSQNKAKFSIKTLDENSEEIHNLEHEVEGVFSVNGETLTLKKVLLENWTQDKKSIEKTFKGNTTNHFIDGVPNQEKEYKKAIEELVDEDVFKLLTSPTYFNESLKWQDRRKTLLDITGNLADADVISANVKLQELTGVLGNKKIEDYKKIIAGKKSEINDEIKSIPIRVNEINKSLPEAVVDLPSIEKEIASIETKLDENATQINNIKNGTAITGKQNELRQIEMDLKEIQNELESEAVEKGHQVNAKIQEEQSNVAILNRKQDDAAHQVAILEKDIVRFDEKLVVLKERWYEKNEQVFTHQHDSDGVCPTCNQSLPVEEMEAAKEKAVATFNLAKSTELEQISATGKAVTEDKAQTLERIEKLKADVVSLEPQIDAKEKTVAKLTEELTALRQSIKDARQDPKYQAKLRAQVVIKEEIQSLKDNAQEAISGVESEVASLRAKRAELNAQIAQQAHATASLERIAELETQQKHLATEYEKLTKETFLIEEFTRTKVEMLEEAINDKFKLARFKLFHQQVDGTLVDTCEVTYDGVPYSSGLNNAARINVGLDVCATLQQHFGFKVPIWIDNSESVVELLDVDTQMISLVVSGRDKQLRIEKQAEKESEVA